MTKAAKAARDLKRKKIEAHRTLWSVVVFHGKDRGLVGLYQTTQEADEVAHEYPPLLRPAARQCLRWQGSRSRNSGVRWAHALRPSGRLSARVLPAAAEAPAGAGGLTAET